MIRPHRWMFVSATVAAACQSKPQPKPPPPSTPRVTIRATDYAFQAPDEIRAGVTEFHLINEGPGLHHALIVRLDSSKTVADLMASLKKSTEFPHWATFAGGPSVPDPGKESAAALSLNPGDYALICILTIPGGIPHYMRGMVRPLKVTPVPATDSGPQPLGPEPDNQMVLSDFAFALDHPITAGTHIIRVIVGASSQPHDVQVIRLNSGKTGDDYIRWIQTMKGSPPGQAVGGTAPAVSGSSGLWQVFTATFTPGDYLLICLVPDQKTGKPHFTQGMIKTVTVK